MVEPDEQRRLLSLYGHMSRLYNSAISHFLSLIVAWTAFFYASKTISLDILSRSIICLVLVAMGAFSWIRVLNFKRRLDKLEATLRVDLLTHELPFYRFVEWLFLRRDPNRLTWGEAIISIMLIVFYLSTIVSIFS